MIDPLLVATRQLVRQSPTSTEPDFVRRSASATSATRIEPLADVTLTAPSDPSQLDPAGRRADDEIAERRAPNLERPRGAVRADLDDAVGHGHGPAAIHEHDPGAVVGRDLDLARGRGDAQLEPSGRRDGRHRHCAIVAEERGRSRTPAPVPVADGTSRPPDSAPPLAWGSARDRRDPTHSPLMHGGRADSGVRVAVGLSMAGKAAELVTLLVLATVVPRVLGPSDYGRFALPLTVVTVGTLALTLGGPTTVARFVPVAPPEQRVARAAWAVSSLGPGSCTWPSSAWPSWRWCCGSVALPAAVDRAGLRCAGGQRRRHPCAAGRPRPGPDRRGARATPCTTQS